MCLEEVLEYSRFTKLTDNINIFIYIYIYIYIRPAFHGFNFNFTKNRVIFFQYIPMRIIQLYSNQKQDSSSGQKNSSKSVILYNSQEVHQFFEMLSLLSKLCSIILARHHPLRYVPFRVSDNALPFWKQVKQHKRIQIGIAA